MKIRVQCQTIELVLERIEGEWCEDREPILTGPLDQITDVDRLSIEIDFEITTRTVPACRFEPEDSEQEVTGAVTCSHKLTPAQTAWLVSVYAWRVQ